VAVAACKRCNASDAQALIITCSCRDNTNQLRGRCRRNKLLRPWMLLDVLDGVCIVAKSSYTLPPLCRENSDQLREHFSRKTLAANAEARQRQIADNTRRRINALAEKTAWDECEAFEGLKAQMAGVAAAQKRADEKARMLHNLCVSSCYACLT
jgi:hypothetical protein